MSIFPFTDPQEVEIVEDELPMAREWAWDFERMQFKTINGRMYQVEGKEAVKIWLWKLFKTVRYRELIFDWDYGSELETLIGRAYTHPFLRSEAERMVREAVEYNLSGYVTEVRNMKISFDDGLLIIEFRAITPYGEVEISV